MPRVSVIIPTYNRCNLLPRAITSAQQAGTNVEVIVVDDASTDNTASTCANIEGIKYLRLQQNQKTAGARNVGIAASSAPYIAFLDDDDWRLPNSIDPQVKLLEDDPHCGVVYGKYLLADQTGNVLSEPALPEYCTQGDIFWNMLDRPIFGCLTAVFRRECVYRIGLLDTAPYMVGIEDYDFWLRIAEQYTVKAVDHPVAVYTKPERRSHQWSSDVTNQLYSISLAYKSKWFKFPRVLAELNDNLESEKRKMLEKTSDRIIYEMAHSSLSKREKVFRTYKAVRCYPKMLTKITFYKTLIKGSI